MAEIKFNGEINFKELMEFACKGIEVEIEKREKTVRKGRQLIAQIENGESVKTKMTVPEIKQVIRNKETEIEELNKKKNDYRWELALREAE